MIRRVMTLALATGLLIAGWSLDEDPAAQLSQQTSPEVQCAQRSPLSALVAEASTAWSSHKRPVYGDIAVVAFAASDDDFGWLPLLGHREVRRIPQRLDHGDFGCSRFQDGSALQAIAPAPLVRATGVHAQAELAALRLIGSAHASASCGRVALHDFAVRMIDELPPQFDGRAFPLPLGITPGTFAVLNSSGGELRTLTITAQEVRDLGNGATAAGYYVSTSAAGTWHFFRIESQPSVARQLRAEFRAELRSPSDSRLR